MSGGADAADALNICPGISRVTTLHDKLQSAPGSTGGKSIGNTAGGFVYSQLHSQMTLYTGKRVNYYVLHYLSPSLPFVIPRRASAASSLSLFCFCSRDNAP